MLVDEVPLGSKPYKKWLRPAPDTRGEASEPPRADGLGAQTTRPVKEPEMASDGDAF